MQSISYLPHFISWVVLGGIIKQLLSPSLGVIGVLLANVTGQSLSLLTDKAGFLAILVGSSVWQGVGWSAIIYLAVLAGVDQSLYEAAEVDGASRLQKALHISLPSLYPLMTIILILRMGQILDAGFDQVFNLYNPLVYKVADVIDTYLYRVGLVELKYDYAAAVGLFRNVVGLMLVISANYLARRYTEYGLW
jgi:putative aldouronate transport system permease protein